METSLRGLLALIFLAPVFLSPSLAAPAAKPHAGKGLIPTYLRCEYLVEPLGLQEPSPRLSWIVESGDRAQRQTACHVIVASKPELLAQDKGDLWDSAIVPGDETLCVPYTGKPLGSHQRCYWKVKVWDKDGLESPWSEPASWTMGILKPVDWKGDWIGYDKPRAPFVGHGNSTSNVYLPPATYFRTKFRLEKPVVRATLYATALGLVDMHLNGRLVSEDYFTPGWCDYSKRVY